MTRGGFYGHFQSKEDLAARSSEQALATNAAHWSRVVEKAEDPMAALVDFYLSERHRDSVGRGCALAALAPDASRHGEALRDVFSAGIERFADIVAAQLPAGDESGESRRKRALAVMATLVGALLLSRVADGDELSADIRAAASAAILGDPGA